MKNPIDKLSEIIEGLDNSSKTFTEAEQFKNFVLEYYKEEKHKYACAVGTLSVVIGELLWQIKTLKK